MDKTPKLTEQDLNDIRKNISIFYEYMKMTEDVIKPIDEIACKAIENIISMAMVSYGRKYGLDYTTSETAKVDSKKEEAIDDIMKDINERTKD